MYNIPEKQGLVFVQIQFAVRESGFRIQPADYPIFQVVRHQNNALKQTVLTDYFVAKVHGCISANHRDNSDYTEKLPRR